MAQHIIVHDYNGEVVVDVSAGNIGTLTTEVTDQGELIIREQEPAGGWRFWRLRETRTIVLNRHQWKAVKAR